MTTKPGISLPRPQQLIGFNNVICWNISIRAFVSLESQGERTEMTSPIGMGAFMKPAVDE